MKCRMLLLAAIGICLIRVDTLGEQDRTPIRLVFDQAHGEQPTAYWGKDSAIFMEEVLAWLSR